MSAAARGRWLPAAVLAVPFVVAIAVLRGLTVEIDTFHGTDAALYHLPTILQFREGVDLGDYPAAQTPLFHLLFTGFGEVFGFEQWRLRLFNALLSYGAALAVLRLLRRATSLEPGQALLLTLVFVLSPYFFGASFSLLTDNLAILFAALALERIHAYRGDRSAATFALACFALCAAVLTRQSFLWLAPVAAWFLAVTPASAHRRLAGATALALALAPMAALVAVWGGLVPPGADPASCGLCTDRPGVGRDALTLRTVGFAVALFGAYAAVLHGPRVLGVLRDRRPDPRALAAPLVAAVVLLAVSPLLYRPVGTGEPGDAGYLWKISDRLPELLGSSLLFIALVPTGSVAIFLLVRRAGWTSLPAVYLGAFLAAALPVSLVYQKYFDPFVLLALALLARPQDLRRRGDLAGVAVLCVAFVAYALSFSGD